MRRLLGRIVRQAAMLLFCVALAAAVLVEALRQHLHATHASAGAGGREAHPGAQAGTPARTPVLLSLAVDHKSV